MSTVKCFLTLVHELAMKSGKMFLDMEERLALGKSGYLMVGYILTMRDVSLDN